MTTVVSTSNTEVPTSSTSYISRWIAQSHGNYQKKPTEYYSSSCDCRTSINACSLKTNSNAHPTITTTWQAQAKSRVSTSSTLNITSENISTNHDNNELQEKLNRIRALLDAKKQRLSRHLSSTQTTSASSTTTIPPLVLSVQDQVHNSTVVGDQSSPSSPPHPSSSSPSALENVYHSHDELLSSSNSPYIYNSCHHHHHHSSPSILPCLMEESPSDSGLSDGTKTTNHDDLHESSTTKNAAIIDLSKPLSKEEMLAIMQIIKELWKKQFDCDIPEVQLKPITPTTSFKRLSDISNNHNNKIQYQSTPVLNKLNAELNDIKDKLKKFSTERQPATVSENKSNGLENNQTETNEHLCSDEPVFVTFGTPITSKDLERMQAKKDTLLHRQIQRREQQLIKKSERQTEAAERHDEYHLFEEYLSQRRQETDQRRANILQAHMEQKRLEFDPPSLSNDYYFATARKRHHLKRKSSLSSFLSYDDDLSYTSSLNLFATPKRSLTTRFDILSPSLTAPTAASRSKMNRAASICNINGHYDSFTSLNSKTTFPVDLFGGSLMNLSKTSNSKRKSTNLIDETLDKSQCSASMTSLATSMTGTRLARSHTLLTTKSNKQTILNSIKQVALAGPANEKQREIVIREIEASEARHFVLLFRDHRLQFRAVYMYIPETDVIEKLHGIGPNIITEVIVDKWFKYNSGSKRFTNIPIRHFSIQCDAIIIYNEFWQKKLHMNINKRH